MNLLSSCYDIVAMKNAWASMHSILFFPFLLLNMFPLFYSIEVYNITPSQPFLPGQTLTSPGQTFELGFFSPNNSSNYYVGIWYKKSVPRDVVWVANRQNPVADSSACLTICANGNMKLVDGQQNTFWSTNVSVASNGSVAVLLDNGNFVLKNNVTEDVVWQSFEYPCQTLLPSMGLWADITSGKRSNLTSWQSDNDPSSGNFLVELTPQRPPQIFIWNGSKPYWRSGQWNTSNFVGAPDMDSVNMLTYDLNGNTEVDKQVLSLTNSSSIISNMIISSAGSLSFMHWSNDKKWYSSWKAPNSQCDIYGACGPNGVCKKSDPLICRCLKGFIPQSNSEWRKGNWTEGCKRRANLLGQSSTTTRALKGKPDGFWKVSGVKLPDFSNGLKIEDANSCDKWCMNNYSCNAYAYVSGLGCLVWAGDLLDIQELAFAGEDLFLRLAHSDLVEEKLLEELIIFFTAILVTTILGTVVYGFCRWKTNHGRKDGRNPSVLCHGNSFDTSTNTSLQHMKGHDSELPKFEFESILIATDNFNTTNQLGQGGYGPVYKGKLQDGKDVAIKRLSSSSGQGVEEFMNEIMLISKLQHRNLVTLIGCCIAREEKILIYEFMSNKSLDTFLFDPTKRKQLDWAKRFNIIQGVARGLLYLHCDSRLRIIHRDLKVSNILLDEKMDPKISDFGLARMFQGTQDLANTQRVVGTLGYMAPEYALGGVFSEKSDVFSFGVLVLEIVSGKKNNSFCIEEQHLSIIAYTWKLWSESKALFLMDEALADSFSSSEVMRCVQIALLCVQDQAADRPTMAAVVSMLGCKETFPQPKEPTFMFQTALKNSAQKEEINICSTNEMTLSPIQGR